MIMRLILCLFCLAMISCNQEDEADILARCTLEVRPALVITLIDDNTEAPIDGATIQVSDGDFDTTLRQFEPGGEYEGPGERPGTYEINIVREGYQTLNFKEPVSVGEDECHVLTQSFIVRLQPS